MNEVRPYGAVETGVEERTFLSQVYVWMTAALALTGVVAALVANDMGFVIDLYRSSLIWFVFIGEIVLVLVLSAAISRLSAIAATAMFFAYAALNGVTLAIIFLVYTDASIYTTFFITAATFGAMSVVGYVTKRDLTAVGSLALMGLIGVLIASVVNLFLRSESIYWLITYAGILVFIGLIAYDTQKLKRMAVSLSPEGEVARKASILGALALYLDFINLFLLLLRLFGRRR